MAATIYIAAGHGGSDPGAVSGKYIEKALTLKTALACQNYLRNYECETVMARTTDKKLHSCLQNGGSRAETALPRARNPL